MAWSWWPWVMGWYAAWSLVALVAFAVDKARARAQRWRIPERTLHAISAAGGWPGSIAAMVFFRHKNRKLGFVAVTAVAAVAHVGAWVAWCLWAARRR